jgi:photosystem II stability/assembly factor-like uncharacterized protein
MKKAPLLAIGLLVCAGSWAALPGHVMSIDDPAPSSWKALGPSGGVVLSMVANPQNSSEVFAIGGSTSTQVLKSADGGRNWTKVSDIAAQAYDIAFNSSNANLLYVLASSGVYRSTDHGLTWTLSSFPSGSYGYSGHIVTNKADANMLYTNGYRWESSLGYMVVNKSTDGGATWASQKPSGGASSISPGGLAVFPTNASIVYVGGSLWDSGSSTYTYKVYKTMNGGTSWQDVSGSINSLATDLLFDPANSSIVYASTIGKVYKTTNGGSSWSPSNGYAYAYALSLDPLNTNILYGAYDGMVYKSTDGGANWASLSSGLKGTGKDVTVLPAGAGILYSSTTGIFKSTDGGTNWQDVSAGFCTNNIQALAFAPSSPGRVYVECQGNDVFRTDSFGDSWTRCPSYTWCVGITKLLVHPSSSNRIFGLASG